jgi:hypothetical protein
MNASNKPNVKQAVPFLGYRILTSQFTIILMALVSK